MQSKAKIVRNMLAAAVILLLSAYMYSCAASRKTGSADDGREKADSAEFIPLHPPVVVPHTWREAINENK